MMIEKQPFRPKVTDVHAKQKGLLPYVLDTEAGIPFPFWKDLKGTKGFEDFKEENELQILSKALR